MSLDGHSLSSYYELDGAKNYFELNGKKGFVGIKDGQEYLYLDGHPATRGFDRIFTDYCCTSPQFFFQIYDDGKLFLIPQREGKYYLVEVDSQAQLTYENQDLGIRLKYPFFLGQVTESKDDKDHLQTARFGDAFEFYPVMKDKILKNCESVSPDISSQKCEVIAEVEGNSVVLWEGYEGLEATRSIQFPTQNGSWWIVAWDTTNYDLIENVAKTLEYLK